MALNAIRSSTATTVVTTTPAQTLQDTRTRQHINKPKPLQYNNSSMDNIKLTQCYHCYQVAEHTKPNCPHIRESKLCAKCGNTEHGYAQCQNEPKCINCGGGHAVTARICTTYAKKLQEIKPKILIDLLTEIQDECLPDVLESLQPSILFKVHSAMSKLKCTLPVEKHTDITPPTSPSSSDGEVASIIATAAEESSTAYEFMNSVYTAFKSITPVLSKHETNAMFYTELDMSQESLNQDLSSEFEAGSFDEEADTEAQDQHSELNDTSESSPEVHIESIPDNTEPTSEDRHIHSDTGLIPENSDEKVLEIHLKDIPEEINLQETKLLETPTIEVSKFDPVPHKKTRKIHITGHQFHLCFCYWK